MNILYYLVPGALSLGLLFLWLFVWSARSGQYDDLYTPAIRILNEESASMNKPRGEPK